MRQPQRVAAMVLIVLFATAPASTQTASAPSPDRTLYVVATSHLDTQWRWTIQETINKYIPATARENFKLFEEFPDYTFSFEGAFRYMLLKEYYPEEYQKLKEYVAEGRWRVVGSWVDAVDVNIPLAESLTRQALYGNGFFKKEFGQTSRDVFLPDCFGFGYALPSIAASCGLKGFSTQKLAWGSAYGVPFDIGVWRGVNGSSLVAQLKPGDYVSRVRSDLSADSAWLKTIAHQGETSGLYAGFKYFGTGDTGGAPDSESVAWVEKSIHGSGPIRVINSSSDYLARNLTDQQKAALPHYQGELLMTRHGVGCYTSQAAMKRWNRRNELLADAAEKASVIADYLGAASYPREQLRESWIRFLWHQFHDDLTGTSIPQAYEFSWNDEILSQKSFAGILENAVEAVAAGLDTRGEGIPLVVYNPLSIDRVGVVEATIVFPDHPFENIGVFHPSGGNTASQIVAQYGDSAKILFLANVPALGFAVYDVRELQKPVPASPALEVTDSTLSGGGYQVKLNADGDVASILYSGRELLSQPLRLELLTDQPKNWPAWEIEYADVMAPPREFVGGSAEITILERGPVRGALQVKRRCGQSEFTQVIRVSQDYDAGVEFDHQIDWREKATLLKAAFHLTSPNDSATYDLSLGTIKRGLDKPELYEVPGHQWADLTRADGAFGAAVLNDCKYGWDHPDAQTLRLTLIHTPGVSEKWDWVGDQASQDLGQHRVRFAVVGHQGDWRSEDIPRMASEFNQPLLAFQATPHPGKLGKKYSFIALGLPNEASLPPPVAIKALKKAEEGDEIIVRLQELHGQPVEGNVTIVFPGPIESAREVNGAEEPFGKAEVHSNSIETSFSAYQTRSFAVKLKPPETRLPKPNCQPLALPYNFDGLSSDDNRLDGDFDGQGRTLEAELLPDTLSIADIPFVFGSKKAGAANAVQCEGQKIPLPKGQYNELHMLACSVEGQPTLGDFSIGSEKRLTWIGDYRQKVGQWNNRLVGGKLTQEANEVAPAYISQSDVGWVGTHHHNAQGENAAYEFIYLYHITLDLPHGAARLTLPDNSALRIMAATLVERKRERIRAAQPLYDGTCATLTEIYAERSNFIDSTVIRITSPTPGAEIHYALDGTSPTQASPLYVKPLTITQTSTVKARAFKPGWDDEYAASLTVERRVPLDPVRISDLKPGLICQYYEGNWDKLPNFDSLKVVKQAVVESVALPAWAKQERYGLVFSGFLQVPRDAMYKFYVESDDGSALYIGGQQVANNDGIHGLWEESGEIALKAGLHPIRILMFQGQGDVGLRVAIEGDGLKKQTLPSSGLFH